MNERRLDELIALAALGELNDDEQRELDREIALDASVAAEVDADLETAAALQGLAAETPPPLLKENVLAAIADVAQQPAESGVPVTSTPSQGTLPRRRHLRLASQVLAAAAVIALVVAGVVLTNQTDDAPTFAAVVQADDADVRALTGTLGGELEVVYSAALGALVLDGREIPQITATQSYQLWSVEDAGTRSLGLFRPDQTGRVMATFGDLDLSGFFVAVTIEPASGSETPTLPIVATV